LAQYNARQLVPNAPEWVILLAAIIFPLFYIFVEFKICHLLAKACEDLADDPDRAVLKLRIFFLLLFGLVWALAPSYYYVNVMQITQEEHHLPDPIIWVVGILGAILHLLIIFGGNPVIQAETRFWAKFDCWKLNLQRSGSFNSVTTQALKVESSHLRYSESTVDYCKSYPRDVHHYQVSLTDRTNHILNFIKLGYYDLHPLDRPVEFRTGYYRSRSRDYGNNNRSLEG
jgi:hypothetical protein